ncbi:hypothetical protein ACFQZ4_02240 [Catellatospora coxensis]
MWRKSVVGVAAILVTALAGCAQSTLPPVGRDGPRSADRDAQLTAAIPELMRRASIPGRSSVSGRRASPHTCERSVSRTRAPASP